MYKYVNKYQEFSNLINSYYEKRIEFAQICKALFQNTDWISNLNEFNHNGIDYVDPFTLLCIINGHSPSKRIELIQKFCSLAKYKIIQFDQNEKFGGVSILDRNHRIVLNYRNSFEDLKISSDLLWDMFRLAVKQNKIDEDYKTLSNMFDWIQNKLSRSWDRLTHGLSYADPENYFALSSPNRKILFLEEYSGKETVEFCNKNSVYQIRGENYFKLCCIAKAHNVFNSLPQLSNKGYQLRDLYKYEYKNYKQHKNNEKTNKENCDSEKIKKLDYQLKTSFNIELYLVKKDTTTYRLRSGKVRAEAMALSLHKCKNNPAHLSFIGRVDNDNYVEAHHLIPMMFQTDPLFAKVNLDVPENIVCLCPNCHRKLHHGKFTEYANELEKLFDSKVADLHNAKIYISKVDFMNLYRKIK